MERGRDDSGARDDVILVGVVFCVTILGKGFGKEKFYRVRTWP